MEAVRKSQTIEQNLFRIESTNPCREEATPELLPDCLHVHQCSKTRPRWMPMWRLGATR